MRFARGDRRALPADLVGRIDSLLNAVGPTHSPTWTCQKPACTP